MINKGHHESRINNLNFYKCIFASLAGFSFATGGTITINGDGFLSSIAYFAVLLFLGVAEGIGLFVRRYSAELDAIIAAEVQKKVYLLEGQIESGRRKSLANEFPGAGWINFHREVNSVDDFDDFIQHHTAQCDIFNSLSVGDIIRSNFPILIKRSTTIGR